MPDLIANYTSKAHCPYCCNDAVVVVNLRRDKIVHGLKVVGETEPIEEMGPCPACEKGHRLEYGLGKDADGNDKQSRHPQWGAEGFWHGRPWSTLPKTCSCFDQPVADPSHALKTMIEAVGR